MRTALMLLVGVCVFALTACAPKPVDTGKVSCRVDGNAVHVDFGESSGTLGYLVSLDQWRDGEWECVRRRTYRTAEPFVFPAPAGKYRLRAEAMLPPVLDAPGNRLQVMPAVELTLADGGDCELGLRDADIPMIRMIDLPKHEDELVRVRGAFGGFPRASLLRGPYLDTGWPSRMPGLHLGDGSATCEARCVYDLDTPQLLGTLVEVEVLCVWAKVDHTWSSGIHWKGHFPRMYRVHPLGLLPIPPKIVAKIQKGSSATTPSEDEYPEWTRAYRTSIECLRRHGISFTPMEESGK